MWMCVHLHARITSVQALANEGDADPALSNAGQPPQTPETPAEQPPDTAEAATPKSNAAPKKRPAAATPSDQDFTNGTPMTDGHQQSEQPQPGTFYLGCIIEWVDLAKMDVNGNEGPQAPRASNACGWWCGGAFKGWFGAWVVVDDGVGFHPQVWSPPTLGLDYPQTCPPPNDAKTCIFVCCCDSVLLRLSDIDTVSKSEVES